MMSCSAFSFIRSSSLLWLELLITISVLEIVPILISLSVVPLFRTVFVDGFDWVFLSEPAILLLRPFRLFWGIPPFLEFVLLEITVFELETTSKGDLFVDSVWSFSWLNAVLFEGDVMSIRFLSNKSLFISKLVS